ncbi:hypothetical protein BS50DRAFT_16093 [Corynespora cassiicola Philippines]|uniref:Uncharacterized protein n=1 Tax=Corynespora cassiicola Philippines TaxID=1448308 RepID=A0A2T2P9W4_CORCC|nr:hypothetical protein BS50DRAFT_16093 [Corynespora cassiicola Philippines]
MFLAEPVPVRHVVDLGSPPWDRPLPPPRPRPLLHWAFGFGLFLATRDCSLPIPAALGPRPRPRPRPLITLPALDSALEPRRHYLIYCYCASPNPVHPPLHTCKAVPVACLVLPLACAQSAVCAAPSCLCL